MPINVPQKPKSGGGGLGSILGAVGGGIASIASGGALAPLAAIAAGSALGGTVGNTVAPGGASKVQGIVQGGAETADTLSRAIASRQDDPVQKIRDGITATVYLPPQERAAAVKPLMYAYAQHHAGQGQELG